MCILTLSFICSLYPALTLFFFRLFRPGSHLTLVRFPLLLKSRNICLLNLYWFLGSSPVPPMELHWRFPVSTAEELTPRYHTTVFTSSSVVGIYPFSHC